MYSKKILIIALILILMISMMPVVKAEEAEFKTITLEQIANSIKEEELKEIAYNLQGQAPEETTQDDIKITKTLEENKLKIVAESEVGYGYTHGLVPEGEVSNVHKLETTFTLDGTTLSSDKIENDKLIAENDEYEEFLSNKFKYDITEAIFSKIIMNYMGYDKEVLYYFWDSVDMHACTLEKEGIQVMQVENGTYDIYQIDLSKRATIFDITPLIPAILLFSKTFENTNLEKLEGLKSSWSPMTDKIIIGQHENEIAVLTRNNSIITSEKLNISKEMTDVEKVQQYAILYFMDCIGQAIYGYKEGELLEVIQKDTINDYTLAKEGFEKIDLGNEHYQYKIDISKKVPLTKEGQKPQEPEKPQNNTIDNNKNEVVDNTTAKGKIPQTGHELTNIIIAIGIISSIIAIIAYKVKKQDI